MAIVPHKTFEEMTPTEQRQHLLELLEDGYLPFFFDENNTELSPDDFLKAMGFRQRKRRPKNGAYVTSAWLAAKVGCDEDTIRKEFLREKNGILKKTYSGRNRKTYTVLRISKKAARKHYPDLEI